VKVFFCGCAMAKPAIVITIPSTTSFFIPFSPVKPSQVLAG
jgi:hypothetical protein